MKAPAPQPHTRTRTRRTPLTKTSTERQKMKRPALAPCTHAATRQLCLSSLEPRVPSHRACRPRQAHASSSLVHAHTPLLHPSLCALRAMFRCVLVRNRMCYATTAAAGGACPSLPRVPLWPAHHACHPMHTAAHHAPLSTPHQPCFTHTFYQATAVSLPPRRTIHRRGWHPAAASATASSCLWARDHGPRPPPPHTHTHTRRRPPSLSSTLSFTTGTWP